VPAYPCCPEKRPLNGVCLSCCVSEVGRKKVAECGMVTEIVRLLADTGIGAELQETVLDLLASLCDAGKWQTCCLHC